MNIGSDNGLSAGRRQAITWTNVGILLIGPLGTNFSEMLIENSYIFIQENPFENVVWKWRPFCLGLNVIRNSDKKHYSRAKLAIWEWHVAWNMYNG